MQEDTNQSTLTPARSDVGFPESKKENKSNKLPIIIAVILVLLLLGGGIYFLLTKPASVEDQDLDTVATPTQMPLESPTPTEASVDKGEISVSVLNGTSVSGLAGKVKTALEKLGYSDIETGNASKKDYETTEVKFATSVPTAVKDEILKELNSTFAQVKTASGSPSGSDIEIITGLPKGLTTTPTAKAATATPKPTGSTTTTPTTTGTVTVSVTPTKTPTPTQ